VSETFTKVIKADKGWLSFDLKALIHYRDLLFLMVRREFVAKYKQTLLGPVWVVLQPSLMALTFVFLFSKTMKVPTDGVPPVLFYFSGILIWNFLSSALGAISVSMLHHAELCKKVYFPRIFLPISLLCSHFFSLLIQSTVLLALYLFFYFSVERPVFKMTGEIVLIPLWLFQLGLLSLGVGTWVAGLTSKYRDFHHLTALGLTVWMYASPISYSLSLVPSDWQWVVMANPVSSIILSFRSSLFGTTRVPFEMQMVSFLVCVLVCFSGVLFFNRAQRNFIDTV